MYCARPSESLEMHCLSSLVHQPDYTDRLESLYMERPCLQRESVVAAVALFPLTIKYRSCCAKCLRHLTTFNPIDYRDLLASIYDRGFFEQFY